MIVGVGIVMFLKYIGDKSIEIKTLENENKNLIKKVVTRDYEIKKFQKNKKK